MRQYSRVRLASADVEKACAWAKSAASAHLYSPSGFPAVWRVHQDDDGAILIFPTRDVPEPGFAIITTAGRYLVLVCDPDEDDEMGPFGTFDEALAGISRWLALPTVSRAATCFGQLANPNA